MQYYDGYFDSSELLPSIKILKNIDKDLVKQISDSGNYKPIVEQAHKNVNRLYNTIFNNALRSAIILDLEHIINNAINKFVFKIKCFNMNWIKKLDKDINISHRLHLLNTLYKNLMNVGLGEFIGKIKTNEESCKLLLETIAILHIALEINERR